MTALRLVPILTKININVIGGFVARVVYLLHTPVFSFAGDAKREFAVAFARFAVVDVADARRDFSAERELFRVNRSNHAVNRHVIAFLRAAPALTSL
jgi:hypothetical protein